jgi:uncharacterized SAM-binding protein YcdF (DUF218 family)
MSQSGYRRVRVRKRKPLSPLDRILAPLSQLLGLPKRRRSSRSRRRTSRSRKQSAGTAAESSQVDIQYLSTLVEPLSPAVRSDGRTGQPRSSRRRSSRDRQRSSRSSLIQFGPIWLRNYLNSYRFRIRRRRLRRWYEKNVEIPLVDLRLAAYGLLQPIRRYPALFLPIGIATLWFCWPLVAPWLQSFTGGVSQGPRPEVISVFVEDPTRSIWALDLWKRKPGALLVMQGRPSSQQANLTYLRNQGFWPKEQKGLLTLEPGCDTVGQVAALARLLQQQRRPGNLTMVTSYDHLPRTLAIARTVIGPMGWKVEGLAVVTQDKRPESSLRLVRDQIRAQILRFTGVSGTRSDETCE